MFQARHIPNLITGLRLALTPALVFLLLDQNFRAAFGLLLLLGLSDALDGFLAKRRDWRSRIGEFLDPVADKLMLIGAFVALAWVGLLPPWLAALVLARDLIIVAGGVAYHFFIGPFQARPSFISKINTFLQLILVGVVTCAQFAAVPASAVPALVTAVTMATLWSGVAYVVVWGAMARNPPRRAPRRAVGAGR